MRPNGASDVTPAAAEALAARALAWLAGDPDQIGALMAQAGLTPDDLRARAGEPEFLGFVLDFLLDEERRARDFALAERLDPERLQRARAALPGGDAPDWT